MSPQVEVLGSKELRKTLKTAGDNLADLKDAHLKVGNLVADVARGLAPTKTGALAASIRPTRAAGGIAIKAAGARLPYGGPIHWGWPARGIEAQPFLSDAATQTEAQWVALYEEEINRIIDTVKGDE